MKDSQTFKIECPACGQRISVTTDDIGREAECPTCQGPLKISRPARPVPSATPPSRTLRIFISSPGDVADERDRARQVVQSLRRRYAGQFELKPLLWEDLPLQPDMSFQQGIDMVISDDQGVDIAVFILWSRLGSPVGATIRKPDGSSYLSGTEREYDLMMQARAQSGGRRPQILVYTRQDENSFHERLRGKPTRETEGLIAQKRLVETFITEAFRDADTGTNMGAYHSFDRPVTFSQRLRTHLQDLLDQMAGGSETPSLWDIETQGPPFMGLEAFQPCHAGVFFGREEEILEARHALREQARNGCAFLLLSGASGSGKSSLARAGVLPAIVENEIDDQVHAWRTLILTPSELAPDPIKALVLRLVAGEVLPELSDREMPVEDLVKGLREAPGLTLRLSINPAFARASQRQQGGVRLLIILDQMEELFASTAISAADREIFLAVIEGLARSGSVWILATVRADFYHLVQTEPALVRMKSGAGQLDLLPPGAESLRRLVEEPARLAGLRFEQWQGHSLSGYIVRDATAHAELLPLVEYVLRELYERRTSEGMLTFTAYQTLGGVEGALAQRAEQVYLSLPVEAQEALDSVLQAMITMGQDGDRSGAPGDEERLVRQRAVRSAFDGDPGAVQFITAFVEERLFTADLHPQTGEATISVAHEALLRVWHRAVAWADRNRDFLLVRARIAIRLQEGSPLLEGDPLIDAAKAHLRRAGEGFSPAQREFIEKSLRNIRAQRRRRERIRRNVFIGLSTLSAAALVAAGCALVLWQRSVASEGRAEANFTEARKAVDEFVTEISREELSVIPGLQDIRQKFAERAVARYAQFAATRPNDPEVRAGLAQAKISLGQVIGGIGSFAKGVRAMEEAIRLLERNAAEDASAASSFRLAKARKDLANLHWSAGDKDAALPLLESCIQILTGLVNSETDPVNAKFELAGAYNMRGNCRREREEEGSYGDYQRGRDIMREILDLHPRKADCYASISAALHNMHFSPKAGKKYAEALALLEESAKYDRLTLELTPNAPQAISNNCIGQCNRAAILSLLGRREEAGKAYESAIDAGRKVVANNPKVTRFQWLLADSLKQFAQHLSSIERFEDSERYYEESVRILEDLVTRADDLPQYAAALIENQLALAEFYKGDRKGQKDPAKSKRWMNLAIQTGKKLGGKFSQAANLNYQFARAYFQLAVFEQEEGNYQTAVTEFRQAIALYRDKVAGASSRQDPYQQAEFLGWIDGMRTSPEKLGDIAEVLDWIEIGVKLGAGCPSRAGKQALAGLLNTRCEIYRKAGRNKEAIESAEAALTIARPAWESVRWHWYLHQSVAGAYLKLSDLYELTGNLAGEVRARQEWLRIWGGPLMSHHTEGLIDPDPPPSDTLVEKLRVEMAIAKDIKRFTIPCDFSGVKYPFHVYITEVRWPKDPLEDQARWLEEERGGKVPEEVRESFRKLHKIAHENNVSFTELCVYALGTATEDDKKRAEIKK